VDHNVPAIVKGSRLVVAGSVYQTVVYHENTLDFIDGMEGINTNTVMSLGLPDDDHVISTVARSGNTTQTGQISTSANLARAEPPFVAEIAILLAKLVMKLFAI
jgi:hypothetical protein